MINKENYVTIQGWMRSELDLKGNELLVYAAIYGFSQTKDQVFNGSRQYLADWCGATKQGIDKCLKSLIDKGLISKSDVIFNGVKYCEYRCLLDNSVVYQPTQLSTPQLSCHNNIELYRDNTTGTNNTLNTIPNGTNGSIRTVRNNTNSNDYSIRPTQLTTDQLFERFWKVYPVKVGKGDARRKFAKLRPTEALTDTMIKAVERQRREDSRWLEGYIPNPSTWLNQRRWEDEPVPDLKGKPQQKSAKSADIRDGMDMSFLNGTVL